MPTLTLYRFLKHVPIDRVQAVLYELAEVDYRLHTIAFYKTAEGEETAHMVFEMSGDYELRDAAKEGGS